MMQYMMPVMFGAFALVFPAGPGGLHDDQYRLLGLGHQYYMNKTDSGLRVVAQPEPKAEVVKPTDSDAGPGERRPPGAVAQEQASGGMRSMSEAMMESGGEMERARVVLSEILKHMGISATVDAKDDGERTILDVRGPDGALIIGKKGQDDRSAAVPGLEDRPPRQRGAPGLHPRRHRGLSRRAARRRSSRWRASSPRRRSARSARSASTRCLRTIGAPSTSPSTRPGDHPQRGQGVFRRLMIVPTSAA